jgi:hypothetical protein
MSDIIPTHHTSSSTIWFAAGGHAAVLIRNQSDKHARVVQSHGIRTGCPAETRLVQSSLRSLLKEIRCAMVMFTEAASAVQFVVLDIIQLVQTGVT